MVGSAGITQELDDVGIQYLPIGVSTKSVDMCISLVLSRFFFLLLWSKFGKVKENLLFSLYLPNFDPSINILQKRPKTIQKLIKAIIFLHTYPFVTEKLVHIQGYMLL